MGLKTGMTSTSSRDWVGDLLERHGLTGYFDCIRTREYTTHLKPDPEPYLVTLRDMGLSADQVFALEDSPPGVASAKGAGLYCVAVLNQLTRLMALDHADQVLASLADLPLEELVNQVQGRKNGRTRSGDPGGGDG
jgi:beta-phosphoglucomutase-like phosphatase (HAD superfamily)